MPNKIANVVCSDCGDSRYAELVNNGGSWSIGQDVPEPENKKGIRRQNMLCGKCRGKGGPGDRLQTLMAQQRAQMRSMGLGGY